MKVILLQELKGRGGEGDVIDVARGYANNYLYREGIAIPATKGNLKQLEQRRHNIAKREEKRMADANTLSGSLEGLTIQVAAQVGDEGQLFGSVTAQMIVDAIKEASGIEVDRRRVELKQPIKTAGEHKIVISIYRDVKTTVNLLVASAAELAALAEAKAAEAAAEAALEAETAPEEAAE